ncbi:hypothetical protein AVEN_26491-1 [Araneus ventricosus]|uniref:Uncharacterized protein n=1 Tax=Araneus ventricosus TaxID=182803 RepID=A0A4Y2CST5_ARAVE|nr:hypothetical protein AVEN_26491-1 [Araneus ventricosus]
MDGFFFVLLSLRVVPYLWEQREDEDLRLIESVTSRCHHLLEKGFLRFVKKWMSFLTFVLEILLFRTLFHHSGSKSAESFVRRYELVSEQLVA